MPGEEKMACWGANFKSKYIQSCALIWRKRTHVIERHKKRAFAAGILMRKFLLISLETEIYPSSKLDGAGRFPPAVFPAEN